MVGYFISSHCAKSRWAHPPQISAHTHTRFVSAVVMLRSTALLEYPEEEPDLVFAGLPAGPRRRRQGVGVGARKAAGLRIVAVAGASCDTSTGLTSASGVSTVSFPRSSAERVGCCRNASRA